MRITKAGLGLAVALVALGLLTAGCGPKEEAPGADATTPTAPGAAAPAAPQAPPGGPPAPTPAGPTPD